MQTFLPYSDFAESAACLDFKRLGKQRVEAWQILQSIEIKNGGWYNHPAVQMWINYETALCLYGMAMCQEWKNRGYKDSLQEKFFDKYSLYNKMKTFYYPPFIGLDVFHASHRAALLYKNFTWYSQFGWLELPAVPVVNGKSTRLPYYWPTKDWYPKFETS